MRRYLLIGIGILLILGLWLFFSSGRGSRFFPGDNNSSSTPLEAGMREISLYFTNSKMDPQVSCNKVFAVPRTVEDTPLAPRKAIEALLLGPTEEEKKEGYLTSVPDGVRLQSLVISDNVATADFNDALYKVGGSCRVAAIYAEISQTLKQFTSVNTVIVTINGKSEDVLQP